MKNDNNEFKNFMDEKKFFPSKKMGQNFLINQNIKEKIVNSIEINKNDYVLEIGPGFGALTNEILKKTKNLEVIEFDKRLVEFLKEKFPELRINNVDILKFNFDEVNKNIFNVISNLPYNISSQIIFKLIKFANFKKAILMVQKEMADRIVAKCGTKKYNNFTVILAITTKIKKEFDVSPKCFYPEPDVFSSIISIEKNKDFDFCNFEKLEKFLNKSFSQKRKTIFNNLKNYFAKEKILDILNKFNIDPMSRPEQIPVNIYKEMFLNFYED